MRDSTSDKTNSVYNSILNILNSRKENCPVDKGDEVRFCFMLHDQVLNEIQKVEVNDLHEWLSDGSFEKTDKLYISFLIKEY
ncbi:MAG: hypothetical protein H0W73_12280 [Bacteroidetes bacterium]|nr:hypothetical protein [Bacteroidota bacterium]